jgi:hypothetical protein
VACFYTLHHCKSLVMDEQQFVQLLEGLLQRKPPNSTPPLPNTDMIQPTPSVSSLPPPPSTSSTTALRRPSMRSSRFYAGIPSQSSASWQQLRRESL